VTEARTNADGSDQDDWDDHWDRFGEASLGNPANDYRHALVIKYLGHVPAGSTLLDIGSGQGQFAIDYKRRCPDVEVWGAEYSAEGVRRARATASAVGVDVRFVERDLLRPVALVDGQPAATHAVCSEVLEHVADPVTLVRNSLTLLAPGARVVVTVPGGPRSAFDKHIGHFQHFTAEQLRAVLTDGGLAVDQVLRTGFPFFNLYKLAVVARGERFVRDFSAATPVKPSRLQDAAIGFFRRAFRLNRDDNRLGWQLLAVAHVPAQPVVGR
jgi:SAM-dependent methyltransferase